MISRYFLICFLKTLNFKRKRMWALSTLCLRDGAAVTKNMSTSTLKLIYELFSLALFSLDRTFPDPVYSWLVYRCIYFGMKLFVKRCD